MHWQNTRHAPPLFKRSGSDHSRSWLADRGEHQAAFNQESNVWVTGDVSRPIIKKGFETYLKNIRKDK